MTESFKKGIYAPLRRTVAKLSFGLVAPEAKEKATAYYSQPAVFGRGEQILDNITDITGKIATFEPDYWKLDGTFMLPVEPVDSNLEIGFWSREISGGDGYFASYPYINVEFSEIMKIPRVGVSFDAASGEVLDSFEIIMKNSSGVVFSQEFEGNTEAYAHTNGGAIGVLSVLIIIKKTAKPFRYARIGEIDFGYVIKFDNSNILNLTLITEGDFAGKSFPVNELRVAVRNDGSYDQLDPESVAQYLNKRQALEYKHGVVRPDENGVVDNGKSGGSAETDWVYCGVYYLENWTVSDSRVEFTACGKAGLLEDLSFFESSFETMTVGNLIRKVLDFTDFDYSLPEVLDLSPPVTGYLGNVSFRHALAMLGELSSCLVYEDRNNCIVYKDLIGDSECVDTIDYDNMFAPAKVKLSTYYNGINLRESTYSSATGEFSHIENIYRAPWHTGKEPDYPLYVDLPMFVQAVGYEEFRVWFLERKFKLLKKRITCETAWRQNPGQSVGDRILVQANKKGGLALADVYKESIEYDLGVLSGSTKVLGEIRHE